MRRAATQPTLRGGRGAKPAPRPARPVATAEGELRCDCGSLLARLLRGDLELKCRRCKRVIVLELDAGAPEMRQALGLNALAAVRCTCGEGPP